MRTVLALASVSLLRLVRDRTALFFMVVLPVLIIMIIGATVSGEGELRVGIVGGGDDPLAADLISRLDASDAILTSQSADLDGARASLRRGELDAVVRVPDDLSARVRAGEPVEIEVYGEQGSTTNRAARTAVAAEVGEQSKQLTAAALVARERGGSVADRLVQIQEIDETIATIEVRRQVVDGDRNILPGGYSYSAPTMLVMFVFVNALAGGGALIENRRLGIHDRVLAGPVSAGFIVAGETVSYFVISLLQASLIIAVGVLFFGVDWGQPMAAAALVVVWALVATGAGMLSGALFRTGEQAESIGVTAGIVAAMLGGCMWPLEIVGPTMQTIGHLVPHAWAVDAWIELLSRGGGLADIARQLLVLAGFALAFLVIAAVRLRARLVR